MINFYEELKLDPSKSTQELRKDLLRQESVWYRRSNNYPEKAHHMLDLIEQAKAVFDSEEHREQYDFVLNKEPEPEGQTERVVDDREVAFNKWYKSARDYYNAGEYDLAKSAIERCGQYSTEESGRDYWTLSADIYRANKDYQIALSEINKAILVAPDDAGCYIGKALIYGELCYSHYSDYDKRTQYLKLAENQAEKAIEKARLINDRNNEACAYGLLSYFMYYYGKTDRDKAERFANTAIQFGDPWGNGQKVIDDINRIKATNAENERIRKEAEAENERVRRETKESEMILQSGYAYVPEYRNNKWKQVFDKYSLEEQREILKILILLKEKGVEETVSNCRDELVGKDIILGTVAVLTPLGCEFVEKFIVTNAGNVNDHNKEFLDKQRISHILDGRRYYTDRASYFYNSGNIATAKTNIDQAIMIDSACSDSELWNLAAIIYEGLGDYSKSIEYEKKAIEFNDQIAIYHLNYAVQLAYIVSQNKINDTDRNNIIESIRNEASRAYNLAVNNNEQVLQGRSAGLAAYYYCFCDKPDNAMAQQWMERSLTTHRDDWGNAQKVRDELSKRRKQKEIQDNATKLKTDSIASVIVFALVTSIVIIHIILIIYAGNGTTDGARKIIYHLFAICVWIFGAPFYNEYLVDFIARIIGKRK